MGYSHFPRLWQRKHAYYIRVALPVSLQKLAKKKEIRYTLGTRDYFVAIQRLRYESLKIDIYLDFLKELNMRIQHNHLVLEDHEVDQLLIQRLKDITEFCDKNYLKLKRGLLPADSAQLFSIDALKQWQQQPENHTTEATTTNDWAFQKDVLQTYISTYLKNLYNKKTTPPSVKEAIDYAFGHNLSFVPPVVEHNPEQHKARGLYFYQELAELEQYAATRVQNTITDTYAPVPRKYQPYMRVIEEERYKELIAPPIGHTKWEDVCFEWAEQKKQIRETGNITLQQDSQCLHTIFSLLDKEYVEDLTFMDCKTISQQIYRVPKKWEARYKGKKLPEILLPPGDAECLSRKSVNKYLATFKSFILFAYANRYLTEDFSNIIIVPKIKRTQVGLRTRFDDKDLRKIFNPETYPRRHHIQQFPRYWIPLIALYTGARLNEICQLYAEDIHRTGSLWYFSFIRNRNDQSLKNEYSWREVPIHPDLIEMGFLDFVKEVKEMKKKRLFYTLKYQNTNHYGGALTKWFAQYLDKLGLNSNKLVFHSFRYTIKQKLRDKKVSAEYQRAILGWERKGIGEERYGEVIPAKELKDAIYKIKYPCLKANLRLIRLKNP